jgi:DNA mismatch repair protein MSH5
MLTRVSDLCGQFDALLALAIGAEKYRWTRPQITEGTGICIQGGRHPLQELVVPCFIPNDCQIVESQALNNATQVADIPRTLILTGPNHSGKSVYLKQVATIVYLAQIGSYVPAERAVLGLTDKILARISTQESVSRVESAFAIDLKQIAQAMRGATARSLVLADEFGKGTSSDDGAGLLAALTDHLLQMGSECPRVLLATHFHEIFEGGYLRHHARLHVAHMQVDIDDSVEEGPDRLTFLFKLAHGHSSSSFGGRCAALNGVPGAVVRRAEAISQLIARDEDIVMACAQLSKQEEEELEKAEGVARRFLEVDIGCSPSERQDMGSVGISIVSMRAVLHQVLDNTGKLS